MADKIDAYARFKEFEAKILPRLREDLKAGLSAQEIMEKYKPEAAAVMVSSMANPLTALAAAEKLLDRTDGKPTQKTEATHRFQNLKEEQLDAMLKSGLESISDDQTEGDGDAH
jgi:hypothetical protein